MKVLVLQLNSSLDYKKNLKDIESLLEQHLDEEVEAVFLPEVFYSMSDGQKSTPHLVSFENDHLENIKEIARSFQVWLLGGTVAFEHEGKILNRALNISPDGSLQSFYDKSHLFKVKIRTSENQLVIDEGKIYKEAKVNHVLQKVESQGREWCFGMGICFDIRFPEFFRELMSLGANVLVIPAAFTIPTGKAHWESLIRARAIENQAYVIASCQWGKHNEKISTYGHSMVVNPWGEIVGKLTEGVGAFRVTLDYSFLEKVRTRMDIQPR